jgi:uncharacterized MAPEG superfamily protein
MTVGLACLLGFAAWTLLLVILGIGSIRMTKVFLDKAKPNDFPADVPHGSERYRRTIRAHANCVENLPIFGAVVITAAIIGARGGFFDLLPQVYLAARVGQSVSHVASGSTLATSVRLMFFLAQLVCVIWLGLLVFQHGMASWPAG